MLSSGIRPLTVVAILVLSSFSSAAPAPREKPKDIDLVLCLDTSNSMDGLIDSAKLRLWDVVNELAKVKPTPNLRVSLYSFGNTSHTPESGWVKKELDLTTDLDDVYARLNGLKTNGGNEFVARVSRDALRDQPWSTRVNTLKIIFVCGNEAADQDGTLSLPDVATDARKAGVIINTIYCGSAQDGLAGPWRTFATLSNGYFANIDQNRAGSVPTIATPFDKPLLELNDKLNATYMAYGNAGQRKAELQRAQDRAANKATAPGAAPVAAVARSVAKANALYRNERWDLGDALRNNKDFDLAKLREEDFPPELQKLTTQQRKDYIHKKLAERTTVQKEINDFAAKRAQFLTEARKNAPKSAGEQALDEALKTMIRKQAAAVGFEVPAAKP